LKRRETCRERRHADERNRFEWICCHRG
jgi:hypothetical protein